MRRIEAYGFGAVSYAIGFAYLAFSNTPYGRRAVLFVLFMLVGTLYVVCTPGGEE